MVYNQFLDQTAAARDADRVQDDWPFWAQTGQVPPESDWSIWLFLGGRGAGKTRAGAEWIRAQIAAGCRRVALIAPTLNDAREVMINGPSGLRQIGPAPERPVYESSRRRLAWPNGAEGFVFSAEDPDSLRGPQFSAAWGDADIDAVAIDWYAPLSDWRDGDHLDAGAASGLHDPAYLAANVEGGEGFDWYYASEADRAAQVRTPITDGAYGRDWVFRYKDLRNWWSQPHVNRKAGTELTEATAWVPESKPIWLTELGCPAVDKGSNQPNVFVDPKSAESQLPYFSSGARDDLIQRRYIEAVTAHWSGPACPVSSVYGGPMIALGDIHVWTWDARPFPDFPVRRDVWSDGENWRLGHWLNGRAGLSPLGLVVREIGERSGVEIDVAGLEGLVSGFVIDRPLPARRALEPLMAAYGFALADRADGVCAISPDDGDPVALSDSDIVLPETGAAVSTDHPEPALLPRDVRLHFRLDAPDYRVSSVYARHLTDDLEAVLDVSLPLLADTATARDWSNALLDEAVAGAMAMRVVLPPSQLALEAGDVIRFQAHELTLKALSGEAARSAELTPAQGARLARAGAVPSVAGPGLIPATQPVVSILDAPLLPSETAERNGVLVAAFADPWPGEAHVYGGPSETDLARRAVLEKPARIGRVQNAEGQVFDGRWSQSAMLTVELEGGELASLLPEQVLAGGNVLLVKAPSDWRWIQFETAELVAPQTYVLKALLTGSDLDLATLGGADVVVADDSLRALSLMPHERGVPLTYLAAGGGSVPDPALHGTLPFSYDGADLAPLAVAHLKADPIADGFRFRWIRRTRLGGDDWASPDVPLAEDLERYLITLVHDGVPVFEQTTTEAEWPLTLDFIESHLGPSPVTLTVRVEQVSARYGPGQPSEITLAV